MRTSLERGQTVQPAWRRIHSQRGLTLIELVVALVLAGLAMGTLWSAWALLSRQSADPLEQRQQLAVAQALLREVTLQPLPQAGVTAGSTPGRTGFASIADYDGLVLDGISDIEGVAVPGLQAYRAQLSVQPAALGGLATSAGWWIDVRVRGPGGNTLALAQWRAAR